MTTNSGNVGINTTAPNATLQVNGFLCVDDPGTAASCGSASSVVPGVIAADGAINANNFDIAEMFYTYDNEIIEPGTLVIIRETKIERQTITEALREDIDDDELDDIMQEMSETSESTDTDNPDTDTPQPTNTNTTTQTPTQPSPQTTPISSNSTISASQPQNPAQTTITTQNPAQSTPQTQETTTPLVTSDTQTISNIGDLSQLSPQPNPVAGVTGNVINELGLETDLTNILEPASNASTSTSTATTSTSGASSPDAEFDNDQDNDKISQKLKEKDSSGKTKKDKILAGKSVYVHPSEKPYDKKIIGVVSTEPALLMGFSGGRRHDLTSVPVTLAGRVPVKVTLENGNIEVGDPLASSSKPGYAMKAIKSGRIIGYALENFNAKSKGDKILVFINAGWYNTPETAQAVPMPTLPEDTATAASTYITKVNGSVIIRIG